MFCKRVVYFIVIVVYVMYYKVVCGVCGVDFDLVYLF